MRSSTQMKLPIPQEAPRGTTDTLRAPLWRPIHYLGSKLRIPYADTPRTLLAAPRVLWSEDSCPYGSLAEALQQHLHEASSSCRRTPPEKVHRN